MIFVSVAMTLNSPPTVFRILPLIFGIFSLVGYLLKIFFIFDTGVFLTFISYLFAVSGLPPTVYNLLIIMLFFFLLLGIWFYGRNNLFISGIKVEATDEYDIGLSDFRRSTLSEILNTLIIGLLLSLLASFIVLYSSLEVDLGSIIETLLMVGLSVAVFISTFLVIKLFSSEKIKTEQES